MKNYAIFNGEKVVNVIVANSKEDAETFSGMDAFEVIDGIPGIGWDLYEENWRVPSPYPSWTWENNDWNPPVPRPTLGGFHYEWNEENLDWDSFELEQPHPSWVRDSNNDWVAPIEYPNDGGFYIWDEDSQSWVLFE